MGGSKKHSFGLFLLENFIITIFIKVIKFIYFAKVFQKNFVKALSTKNEKHWDEKLDQLLGFRRYLQRKEKQVPPESYPLSI
jgi:hypothetical protein